MPTILVTLYIFGMHGIMKTIETLIKNKFSDDSIIKKRCVKSKPLSDWLIQYFKTWFLSVNQFPSTKCSDGTPD